MSSEQLMITSYLIFNVSGCAKVGSEKVPGHCFIRKTLRKRYLCPSLAPYQAFYANMQISFLGWILNIRYKIWEIPWIWWDFVKYHFCSCYIIKKPLYDYCFNKKPSLFPYYGSAPHTVLSKLSSPSFIVSQMCFTEREKIKMLKQAVKLWALYFFCKNFGFKITNIW